MIDYITELHAFWFSLMQNENVDVRLRLRASELLAKSCDNPEPVLSAEERLNLVYGK